MGALDIEGFLKLFCLFAGSFFMIGSGFECLQGFVNDGLFDLINGCVFIRFKFVGWFEFSLKFILAYLIVKRLC